MVQNPNKPSTNARAALDAHSTWLKEESPKVMQLRTAGPRIPANDLELPQQPSLLQSPKPAAKGKAVAEVEGKEGSLEKLKKVKNLQKLRSLKNQRVNRVETRLLW